MKITVRPAQFSEYPALRDIMARAFKSEDEPRLWDHLVSNDPNLKPEGVRVAVADGRPVACTVVLPRQIRVRQGNTCSSPSPIAGATSTPLSSETKARCGYTKGRPRTRALPGNCWQASFEWPWTEVCPRYRWVCLRITRWYAWLSFTGPRRATARPFTAWQP